jgi:hypothetical protein
VLEQSLSLVGAFLILAAYVANQRGWLTPRHAAYNIMNLVGSLCLLWIALVDWRWGFIVLEAVWALVSIPPLFKRGTQVPAS